MFLALSAVNLTLLHLTMQSGETRKTSETPAGQMKIKSTSGTLYTMTKFFKIFFDQIRGVVNFLVTQNKITII